MSGLWSQWSPVFLGGPSAQSSSSRSVAELVGRKGACAHTRGRQPWMRGHVGRGDGAEVALERDRRRNGAARWGLVQHTRGGGPSHHAQPKVRARGACEGCRTENTHLHASCFKRRALLRSLQGVGGYLNGYADGDSDDSAECNGSGVDDRSGVEDRHAWRRAGNGNGKECIRAMVLPRESCGVCRGEAMYVPGRQRK